MSYIVLEFVVFEILNIMIIMRIITKVYQSIVIFYIIDVINVIKIAIIKKKIFFIFIYKINSFYIIYRKDFFE